MNNASSGETLGSPLGVTVAKATCRVPCRYATTCLAESRRSGVTMLVMCALATSMVAPSRRASPLISSGVSNMSPDYRRTRQLRCRQRDFARPPAQIGQVVTNGIVAIPAS